MNTIPIIDPHQHFWDLDKNYHPWLCDPSSIPFRYGDYTALKRNYLPDSYEKDASGFNVVGTVYVEAEWDPKDPIGETLWVTALANHQGLPSAIVAQAWLDHEDAAEVLRTQAAFARV
ncbi:MAG: thioesterase, partial [Pseudomonadota bacterium]